MNVRLEIRPAWRVWSGIGLAVVGTVAARPVLEGLLVGTLCTAYGLAWRLWAAGHVQKGETVTTTGPYRLHRHPLYWGTFWLGVGFACMVHRPAFWIAFLVYYTVVYSLTIRQEERFLRSRFGALYETYAAQTPAWLPKPRGRSPSFPEGHWSWPRVRTHREHRTTIVVLLWTLFFWVRWGVGRFGV